MGRYRNRVQLRCTSADHSGGNRPHPLPSDGGRGLLDQHGRAMAYARGTCGGRIPDDRIWHDVGLTEYVSGCVAARLLCVDWRVRRRMLDRRLLSSDMVSNRKRGVLGTFIADFLWIERRQKAQRERVSREAWLEPTT